MRRCPIALLLVTLCVLLTSPALARDPFGDDPGSDPAPPQRDPDPAPLIAPPPDIYYVTDTYVADVVTSSGPLTTYSTATVHESTGSYARVLENVGTGEPSAFDGAAFNGRRTLGDGRSVAGTYYENYVLTDGAFVPVSIVFFQDDAELARLRATNPPAVIGGATPRSLGGFESDHRGASASPSMTEPDGWWACCASDSLVPSVASLPRVAVKPVRLGASLLPTSVPLRVFEVLRGRAVALWPRAFVDDREIPIRSWTVVAGDGGEAVATTGSGDVPFRTFWKRLAPPDAAYEVLFRIEVDTPETGHRTVDLPIAVTVRSPALEG